MPLVKELSAFSLFVDTTGTRDTALAIVNPGAPAILGGGKGPTTAALLSLFDKSFSPIATTDFPLDPGERVSDFVRNFFLQEVPEEGSLTVTSVNLQGGGGSGTPMATLRVRTNNLGAVFPDGVPTFTAFPVVPGAAALLSTGVMGTVTQESSGRLNVALHLRAAAHPVTGAIFYVFDRGELISEVVRSVSTRDFASFVLEPPGHPGPLDVKGVEVRLSYEGGEITPRMPVQ